MSAQSAENFEMVIACSTFDEIMSSFRNCTNSNQQLIDLTVNTINGPKARRLLPTSITRLDPNSPSKLEITGTIKGKPARVVLNTRKRKGSLYMDI